MASNERMISAAKLVTVLAKKFRNGMIHYDDLMAVIADVPTEKVVEVEQGCWEPHPYHPGLVRCSKCKERIIREDAADEEIYCSKCGTRLVGGNEDT